MTEEGEIEVRSSTSDSMVFEIVHEDKFKWQNFSHILSCICSPAGPQAPHGDGVMVWNMQAEPILHEMEYKDGKLVIQKEGYYYVYSKIFFSEVDVAFTHSVCRTTPRYLGKDIELLKSRRYHPKFGKMMSTSNSYLGGVFHLFEDDSIFVKVKNVTQVRIQHSTENVFGIYMI